MPQVHNDLQIPPFNGKRVVVAGGGFGGIALIRKLRNKGFQVVLIDRNNYHTFQPLLYQVATGGLEPDSIAYPLRKIFQGYRDFYFRMATIQSVDVQRKEVITDIGMVSYDYLVIALGSTNNFFGSSELASKAMPLKSVTDALDLRSLILQNLEAAINATNDQQSYLHFVVVGGGPTGVETAGALCELRTHVLPSDYPEIDFRKTRVTLIESGNSLLGGMSEFASANALKSLRKLGAEVLLNTAVAGYDGEKVILRNGETLYSKTLIWSAGVKGVPIDGLPPDAVLPNHRIVVDNLNRVAGAHGVFIAGDLACMIDDEHPKGHPMVAQVAIQQGKNIAYNLINELKGKSLRSFRYTNPGSLATIGRNKAVADLPFIKFKGFTAWMVWLVIHLMTLVGFRNRVVVFVNWCVSYFSYDRAIRLIVRPFVKR